MGQTASGPNPRFTEVSLPVDSSVQRANAGFLAPGQTKVTVSGRIPLTASSQTVPLPTPPAGKVWAITDPMLTHNDITALEFKVQTGGIDVLVWPVKGDTAPLIVQGMETQFDFPQGNAPQIIMPADNGKVAYFLFAGVQQSIGNG